MTGGRPSVASVADAGLASAVLSRRDGLRRQLGEVALEQFERFASDPTAETAATLNTIWIRSLFTPLLMGLLRDVPEAKGDIGRALRALETVRMPPRVDHREFYRWCPYDTQEERRGER